MKKFHLVTILCTLLMLVAFSGCKKNEGDQKADAVKQSIQAVYNTFNDLETIAKNAGDDCAKFGKEASDSLNKNKESAVKSMAFLKDIDEDAPEMKAVDKEWKTINQIMDDDNSALNKILDKCGDDPALADFGKNFLEIFGDSAE